MAPDSPDLITFGEFRLDLAARTLQRGNESIPLRPRTWDVLVLLVANSGRTVPREQLLREVWKGDHVGDETVATSIRELRRVFGDSVRQPRYLQTLYKQGYRFLEPVYRGGRRMSVAGVGGAAPNGFLVGRNAELVDLMEAYDAARHGQPQSRLVTGAAGIGKSALVTHFLRTIDGSASVITGLGRCVEQRGRSEPYLPIMQLLSAMAAHPLGKQTRSILRRHASQWWVHLPSLHEDGEDPRVFERAGPGFAPRMIREFASAIEILARNVPVVVVVEDIQWSDASSLDALSALLRRPGALRVLLVATLRSDEASNTSDVDTAALRQRLESREITLGRLSSDAVHEYLDTRFGTPDLVELAPVLHTATGGHPMFLVRVVEELIAREMLTMHPNSWSLRADLAAIVAMIPSTLAETVGNQLDRLGADHYRIASAASVTDDSFATDTIASACAIDASDAEAHCRDLARSGFFESSGIQRWPNGTEASTYRFAHELYRATLYERLGPALRQSLHGAVASRLETALLGGTDAYAATLAHHFERAGKATSAVRQWRAAAMHAMRAGSPNDALHYLASAIELLERQPASAGRDAIYLELATARASLMLFTRGYADPEATPLFETIRTLSGVVTAPQTIVPALVVLQLYALWQRDFPQVDTLDRRFAETIATNDSPTILLQACRARGLIAAARGRFTEAIEQLRRALELYDAGWQRPFTFLYRSDVGVDSLCFLSICELVSGKPDSALATIARAIACGRELEHPPSVSFAMHVRSAIYHGRLEWRKAIRSSEEQIAYADANELEFSRREGIGLGNWARIELGKSGDAMESLALAAGTADPTSASFYGPYFIARLGSHLGKTGRSEEAIALVDASLKESAARNGLAADAELLRVRASLHDANHGVDRQGSVAARAKEETLRRSIEVAGNQNAKLFLLRASVDLARLLARSRRRAEGHALVADALDSFHEGEDLPDVRSARRLLTRT